MRFGLICGVLLLLVLVTPRSRADEPDTGIGDRLAAEYFEIETAKLSGDLVDPVATLDQWQVRKKRYRGELAEMLGLDPMPPRTPLQSEVVGTNDHDDYRVERLHFQAMPGLYVAANFYRPIEVAEPLPTILYLCGHSRQAEGDVSFGNKTAYHHHGVWFARNGYTCLIVDTIQWGEFLGEHHGTYRLGRWWWANHGYTPAGVEAWTAMRALDYLESREEVDADRFGVTGRSGGGIYTWWVAAFDERVKVAVPVAGITTLHNYVVDGCVEGHCDCMFMVNTYRWDYSRVAALLAPRPLLISNSDKDGIFPLDGVVELHRQVREVYRLYGAEDNLGLQITEGPHQDTQNLRVHAFQWMNRFLKRDDGPIRMVADKSLDRGELRVFTDALPEDEIVTSIDETFMKTVEPRHLPKTKQELRQQTNRWIETLRQKTFGAWPSDVDADTKPERTSQFQSGTVSLSRYEFDSTPPYRLPFYVLRNFRESDASTTCRVELLDNSDWDEIASALNSEAADPETLSGLAERYSVDVGTDVVLFPPRGIGPTRWSDDPVVDRHLRRRFLLLGQSDDAMRIFDVCRLLDAIFDEPTLHAPNIVLSGSSRAAVWALYASLMCGRVDSLQLQNLPTVHRDRVTLLNVSKYLEMPQVVAAATTRVSDIRLIGSQKSLATWRPILENGLADPQQLQLVPSP